jgi:hypothetical protein
LRKGTGLDRLQAFDKISTLERNAASKRILPDRVHAPRKDHFFQRNTQRKHATYLAFDGGYPLRQDDLEDVAVCVRKTARQNTKVQEPSFHQLID